MMINGGNIGRKRAVLVMLGGSRDRFAEGCPRPAKRTRRFVEDVVYTKDQATQSPPPARTVPEVVVVPEGTVPPLSSKAMKILDPRPGTTGAGVLVSSGPGAEKPATTTTAATPSTSATPVLSTRASAAAAAAARNEMTAKREQEEAAAQMVVTEEVTATLTASCQSLESKGSTGLSQLLSFLVNVQVKTQDHQGLFDAAMKALKERAQFRKEFCDFERVMDMTNVVYGKKPSPIFLDVEDVNFALSNEVYDQHLFMRLFCAFVVTRLQLIRGDLLSYAAGEKEIALVDKQLKAWASRSYYYM